MPDSWSEEWLNGDWGDKIPGLSDLADKAGTAWGNAESGHGSWWTAAEWSGAAIGGTVVAGFAATLAGEWAVSSGSAIIGGLGGGGEVVTHWLENGEEPNIDTGDWVMQGSRVSGQYFRAGLEFWNKYNYSNSISAPVGRDELEWPSGWESWKAILGQRIYTGPPIIPNDFDF